MFASSIETVRHTSEAHRQGAPMTYLAQVATVFCAQTILGGDMSAYASQVFDTLGVNTRLKAPHRLPSMLFRRAVSP
jgi:hypothetical protein